MAKQSFGASDIRMDFGSGGKEFWHTWWPHNGIDSILWNSRKNSNFAIVDTLWPHEQTGR